MNEAHEAHGLFFIQMFNVIVFAVDLKGDESMFCLEVVLCFLEMCTFCCGLYLEPLPLSIVALMF